MHLKDYSTMFSLIQQLLDRAESLKCKVSPIIDDSSNQDPKLCGYYLKAWGKTCIIKQILWKGLTDMTGWHNIIVSQSVNQSISQDYALNLSLSSYFSREQYAHFEVCCSLFCTHSRCNPERDLLRLAVLGRYPHFCVQSPCRCGGSN